ncbi:MAG: hypothetical protein FJ087_13115, partial [Deltaproteobacteria bacterium]|nr:hypothetical protein [Deltaproteobacteria bacterium]
MTFDLLPQVAAAVVAGVASVTDALRGKIYNKVVVFGLGLTLAWLATLGGLTWAGGDTILVRFPELGHFGEPPAVEAAMVAAAAGGAGAGAGTGTDRAGSGSGSGTVGKTRLMPWEETPGQSVWPPVPTHDPVDVEVTQSWTEEDDAAQTAYDARNPDAAGVPVWTEPGSFWIYVAKVALNP